MPLRFLTGSATQGSADAFAEVEFATGLSGAVRTAYRIRLIEFYVPLFGGVTSSAECLIRRSSAAAMSYTNAGVIAAFRRGVQFTTSGQIQQEVFPNRQVFERDADLLIVEETLYFHVDSTATTVANTFHFRIGYETRSITENERLSIMAATAQG